jgi:hypothetical protein
VTYVGKVSELVFPRTSCFFAAGELGFTKQNFFSMTEMAKEKVIF